MDDNKYKGRLIISTEVAVPTSPLFLLSNASIIQAAYCTALPTSQKSCFINLDAYLFEETNKKPVNLDASCDNEEARVIHAAKIPMAKFQAGRAYGSCNGLMYFAGNSIDNIVVSNPFSSQFRMLPPSHIEMYGCWDSYSAAIGLGFDSLSKTFKRVCSKKGHRLVTVVHTLQTTSWREVSGVPAYYCYCDIKSVFVQGFLHWMTKPLIIKDYEGRILAFDVSKETLKVIPPP